MLLSYVPGQDWATQQFVQTAQSCKKLHRRKRRVHQPSDWEWKVVVTLYCHSFSTTSTNVSVACFAEGTSRTRGSASRLYWSRASDAECNVEGDAKNTCL